MISQDTWDLSSALCSGSPYQPTFYLPPNRLLQCYVLSVRGFLSRRMAEAYFLLWIIAYESHRSVLNAEGPVSSATICFERSAIPSGKSFCKQKILWPSVGRKACQSSSQVSHLHGTKKWKQVKGFVHHWVRVWALGLPVCATQTLGSQTNKGQISSVPFENSYLSSCFLVLTLLTLQVQSLFPPAKSKYTFNLFSSAFEDTLSNK